MHRLPRCPEEADRVDEHVRVVVFGRDFIGAVGVRPRGDLHWLTPGHVYRGAVLCHLSHI